MIRKFLGRNKELNFLDKEFSSSKNSFVVIYGRRRVGKTELIKKFLQNKTHIYFLVSQESTGIQLERLIAKVASFFDEKTPLITDWIEGIDYIGEKLKSKKLILVIDEFPYLINSNNSIPSYFQRLNDEYLIGSESMIILSGSSIGMMESEVLGHKSPIFGRRTGQIDLQPFSFKTICSMIDENIEDIIVSIASFGRIPLYISFYDNNLSLKENIFSKILDKDSYLYKEPEFILKQELREPSKYMSILFAIASGNTRLNEISNRTRVDIGTLSKYIEQLLKLRLIRREVPITERNKKTKKSLYFIDDGLFNFWFRFVEPNLSDVEDNPKRFLETIVIPNLPSFVSKTFEFVCKDFVRTSFNYGVVGSWWHKDKEIDIVALNESKKEILFAECKWKNKVNAKKTLKELKEKSKYVQWNNDKRKESYAIFAKSFKKKIKEKGLYLFDLKDLKRVFS